VFAQEEQQLRRPRDDPFRRQAITRCRQPGRSLWLSGRRSWHDCIGDKALARIQPDRRCGARSDSPRSERPARVARTIAFVFSPTRSRRALRRQSARPDRPICSAAHERFRPFPSVPGPTAANPRTYALTSGLRPRGASGLRRTHKLRAARPLRSRRVGRSRRSWPQDQRSVACAARERCAHGGHAATARSQPQPQTRASRTAQQPVVRPGGAGQRAVRLTAAHRRRPRFKVSDRSAGR
jgi:hypothetical protein